VDYLFQNKSVVRGVGRMQGSATYPPQDRAETVIRPETDSKFVSAPSTKGSSQG